jgi:hypothetical protein
MRLEFMDIHGATYYYAINIKGPFGWKESERKKNCGNQCMNID